MKTTIIIFLILFLNAAGGQGFQKVSLEQSGIDFRNVLKGDIYSGLENQYFFSGGGVAIGDINNDGLEDVYFTGNQVADKLYLNEGGLKFKDVTEKFFPNGAVDNHSGVTMVDINSDGWLDIYVSVSGSENSRNKLFINNGGSSFSEKAKEYGIDDSLQSVHATFFDADLDGDLDILILNRSFTELNFKEQKTRLFEGYNRLMINESGKFIDKSKEYRISNKSSGLGVIVSDFNNDFSPDYYLINDNGYPSSYGINYKGLVFREFIYSVFGHVSKSPTCVNAADLNRDGWTDLYTTNPNRNSYRVLEDAASQSQQSKTKFPTYNQSALQLNFNGFYTDVSNLSGVSNYSDFWSSLIADFDNDGYLDVFLMNGPEKDYSSNYFRNYLEKALKSGEEVSPLELNSMILTNENSSTLLKNNGNLTFSEVAFEHSNSRVTSAAFVDLDLDGDLDLVCNALDETSFILENKLNNSNHFLDVQLTSDLNNIEGIGAKIMVYTDSICQKKEVQFNQGYQSSVTRITHFGIGDYSKIDSLVVWWNSSEFTILRNINSNQKIEIDQVEKQKAKSLFERKTGFELAKLYGFKKSHIEKEFNDFNLQPSIPFRMSSLGPLFSVGFLNSDSLVDIFVPGPSGQSSTVFFQTEFGEFIEQPHGLVNSIKSEDLSAVILDCDNDGDNDIYVVTGGNEFKEGNALYQDRLYLNNGMGDFVLDTSAIPNNYQSNLRAISWDINFDGWQDILVFGRQVPGAYPDSPGSKILINHEGKFKDETSEFATDFTSLGMVTDIELVDFDNDNDQDLMIVGEMMPITFFENDNGILTKIPESNGLSNSIGFWNSIDVAEDESGKVKFYLGNIGENSRMTMVNYFNSLDQKPSKYASEFNYANSVLEIVNENFELTSLPDVYQMGPINKSIAHDFTKDGIKDLVFLGNRFETNDEMTRLDGNLGLFLNGNEDFFTPEYLGLIMNIKDAELISINGIDYIILGINNGRLIALQYYN